MGTPTFGDMRRARPVLAKSLPLLSADIAPLVIAASALLAVNLLFVVLYPTDPTRRIGLKSMMSGLRTKSPRRSI